MFLFNNMAGFLGFGAMHDDLVVEQPLVQLGELQSKTLEEKKAIVSEWLLIHDINDPAHIDENGQETRFMDWAVEKNALDFAIYLKGKGASCSPQMQQRLQHFITPEMRFIINANTSNNARVFEKELWVDANNLISRLVSTQAVFSANGVALEVREIEKIIPCIQIGVGTNADSSVIPVIGGNADSCAGAIHKLANWLADQVGESPRLSDINKRREALSRLEEKRKAFFSIMHEHSNLSYDFWYEGLKKAFERGYFFIGRGLDHQKRVALSYCTIVDAIKMNVTLKERADLLNAIKKVTPDLSSSKKTFDKTNNSDYKKLCKDDAEFYDRVIRLKVSLQGWCAPEPYVDPFAAPPPPSFVSLYSESGH